MTRLKEATATEYNQVIALVLGALAKALAVSRWDLSVESMYPDKVVIAAKDGKRMAYPYQIDDANRVTFGESFEVVTVAIPAVEGSANTNTNANIADADAVFVEAVGSVAGGRWLIRVIRAGISENNVFYSDTLLREAAPLFDGARVFAKSDDEHIKGQGKDVRNLIGGLESPRFVEGVTPDSGEIQAELVMIQPDGDVGVKLREAFDRKLSGLFGFSLDAEGNAKQGKIGTKTVRIAESITKVLSVDLIVEPGAGGRLIRLIESAPNPSSHLTHDSPEEDHLMRKTMLAAILAKNPNFDADKASDEQVLTAYREAVSTGSASGEGSAADIVTASLREIRLIEARTLAREKVAASTLPPPAKDKLLTRFAEAKDVFAAADVDAAIDAERAYLAKFTESGRATLPHIEVGDRSQTISDMLDAFFDPKHKGHRNTRSFRECYRQMTGDKNVTGRLEDCNKQLLREAAGEKFREAVTTAGFGFALGDAIQRRMLALYAGETDLQAWRNVATTTPAADFRTMHRVTMGGYGNLPVVGQNGAYQGLTTPTDAEATYAVAKRGGLETITLEAIKNDDVGMIQRIPQELALAAANTLYEFVFDFFRTNPAIYDAKALYHVDRGNLFANALSAAEFSAHRLAMLKQTRGGSAKRMAVSPTVLLVPFELQETAYNQFVRGQNLDKTFVQTVNPNIITVSYWTDTTDWCTVADPNRAPLLEIAFLDGREEPDLFVQDAPNSGSVFTNDAITYKIRHVYGGSVLPDGWKYTTKAVVA